MSDIPKFGELSADELAALSPSARGRVENQETSHAEGNSGSQVCGQVEAGGIEGEPVCGLPSVNGAELCDRQEPKQGTRKGIPNKEKKARQQKHLAQFHFRQDKHNPNRGIDRVLNGGFRKSVTKRMELYRSDALDALYDIAMQPIAGLG